MQLLIGMHNIPLYDSLEQKHGECEDDERVAKHQLRRNLQPAYRDRGAAEPTA